MGGHEDKIRRVTRSKEEARASYNRMSAWYELLAGSSERRLIDAGLRLLEVRAGERVLEIGPGTGYALAVLARAAGQSGRVTGLDISEGMLAAARRRLERARLAERVELKRGDGTCLPVETGSLDVVWISFTLELFDTPEIPIVLAECRRALRPGGRLGIVAMSRRGQYGPVLRLYEWMHDRLPRIVDCRPIEAEEAVRRAGLQIVESVLRSTWGLPVEIILGRA